MKISLSRVRILLSILLISGGLSAQTIISTDTTWDTDQILTGDLIINSGVTLTVKPAVKIQAVYIDQDLNGQGDIDIIVNGSLIALGKQDSIIYFIPYDDTTTSDYHEWGGIDVGSNATIALDYCNISFGYTGLDIGENASVVVNYSSIANIYMGMDIAANASVRANHLSITNIAYIGLDITANASVVANHLSITNTAYIGLDIAANASVVANHLSITDANTGLATVEANVNIENSSIIDTYSGIKVIQGNISTGHQFYLANTVINGTTIGIELTGTNTNFITLVDVVDPDSIGILIHNGSHTNTTVLSSHIYSQTLNVNTADVAGISVLDGAPEIMNTEVSGFYKGFNVESNSQLKYNYVHDNVFAATWLNGSTGTLEYSEISGNGTGPFIDDNSTPSITNNNLLANADIVGGATIPTFGLWANNTNGYTSNDWPVPGNAGLQFNVIGAHDRNYNYYSSHHVYIKSSYGNVTLYDQYSNVYSSAVYIDEWANATTSTKDAIYVYYTSNASISPWGKVPFVKVSGVAPSHLLCANDGLSVNAEMNWWGQISGVVDLLFQKNAGTVSYGNWKTQVIPDAGLQNAGKIAAIIRDAATGEVLSDVTITNTEHDLILYSGADGTFDLPGLLAGSYSLSYQKSGYNTRNTTSTITASTGTLDLGVIYLSPTGSLLGPLVTNISPGNGTRSADSLQTVAIEVYDEDGIDNNSVRISVNGVSYGLAGPALTLTGSTLLFNIADLGSSFSEETVSVSVDSLDDVNGYHLLNPQSSTFYVDLTPPQILEITPADSAIIRTAQPVLTAKLSDNRAINPDSLLMTIEGVTYPILSTSGMTWSAADSLLTFSTADAGVSFPDGDTINVSLSVIDSVDYGTANRTTQDWFYRVNISVPTATVQYPQDGEITADSIQVIAVTLADGSGIDGSTISLTVNGTEYDTTSAGLSYAGTDLVFTPDAIGLAYADGPVTVHLQAADVFGDTLIAALEWTFQVDLTPPQILEIAPADSAIVRTAQPVLTAKLSDNRAINTDSLLMTIGGVDYPILSTSGMTWSAADSLLTFSTADAGVSFPDGDTINISLTVIDSVDYGMANRTTEDWFYGVNYSPPSAVIRYPLPNASSSESAQRIAITLSDGSGIDNSTIELVVDSILYGISSAALSYVVDSLIFDPSIISLEFAEGPVAASLRASDIPGDTLAQPLEWTFFVDTQGPEITSTDPQKGGIVSKSNQLVTVKITDEWSAIDAASIVFRMTINGIEQQYSISDAGLTWNAADSILIFDPSAAGVPFADGDSVAISLQVSDHIDLGDANSLAGGPYTWDFTVTILGDLSLQLNDHADNALDDVRVSILRNGTAYREVSTDTTGNIELALSTNSAYSVSCSKPGYFHYHVSDISLNESTPESLTVKLGQLGDYNVDGAIDFYDVDAIVSAYREQDASIEFGPVGYNDTIPDFNVLADGVFDFEDIMIFTLIWNHHEGLSEAALVAFAEIPTKQTMGAPKFTVSENIGSEEEASRVQYTVVIEEVASLRSSRLVFKYDPASLKYVSFQKTAQLNSTIPNKLLVLSSSDGENGYLELNMANLSAQTIASGDIFGYLIFETMRENYGGITYAYDIIDDQDSVSQGKTEIIALPKEFALHQNYPNPFNPTTTIRFELPKATKVYLVIYDILGREVARLVDGYMESGYRQVVWNGKDGYGRDIASGIYIVRMLTPEYTRSIKTLLLK